MTGPSRRRARRNAPGVRFESSRPNRRRPRRGPGGGAEGRGGAAPAGSGAGHRLLEHVADCLIEAWGPDAASCAGEALAALVESFARVDARAPRERRPLRVAGTDAEDALARLLEEVIFTVETRGEIPVGFHLHRFSAGEVTGEMEVVALAAADLVGPSPKAVSYHGLEMREGAEGWRCRVLVDQ